MAVIKQDNQNNINYSGTYTYCKFYTDENSDTLFTNSYSGSTELNGFLVVTPTGDSGIVTESFSPPGGIVKNPGVNYSVQYNGPIVRNTKSLNELYNIRDYFNKYSNSEVLIINEDGNFYFVHRK